MKIQFNKTSYTLILLFKYYRSKDQFMFYYDGHKIGFNYYSRFDHVLCKHVRI